MKPSLSACAALAALAGAALMLLAEPPAPRWLKMIDQGQTEPRLKGYFAPDGVKVEIVAELPAEANPAGMAFAEDGGLFVLEWLPDDGPAAEATETVHYKDGSTRLFRTRKKKVKDRVQLLRDSNGNGTFDQAEVVLQDDQPSGILLSEGWLYLAGRSTVRRYRRSKPGGPYDVREVAARGFFAFDTRQVSGLTLGNDGWLYVTAGKGDSIVEGSDGSRATVLRSGAVFRCRPDGARVEVWSDGCVNPRGAVAFDGAFNAFLADDGDDPGKVAGCRLLHVAEGTDFGRLPPVLRMGRGAPAGLLCYNDTRFPQAYRGLLYYPDASRRAIHAYRVEPYGATFAATEEFDFLRSDDPRFRPCQVLTGPDGAMYVCDSCMDPGADRLGGDGRHGRILRVRWAGTDADPAIPLRGMDSWAKLDRMSEDDLVKALAAPDFSDRQRAQRALVRRGEKVRPALVKLLDDEGQPVAARIAALGVLESFWNDEVEGAVLRRLDDEADLRRLAADALALNCARGDRKAHEALLQSLGDGNLAVRRAVALAMGRIAGPGAPDALANSLAFDDGKDLYLREGLVRAVESLGKPGIDRLRALAESGAEGNTDRAVAAFLMLRTRPGADAVPDLLKNPHLSIAQRAALVRSYGNYLIDPPVDVEPLMAYLLANRDEALLVKRAGLEVLSLGSVHRGDKAREWLRAMLEDKDPDLVGEAARLLRAGDKSGSK